MSFARFDFRPERPKGSHVDPDDESHDKIIHGLS